MRAFPYALENANHEMARFARWAGGAALAGTISALAGDLARFEAAARLLMREGFIAPAQSPFPRRSRNVVVLHLSNNPSRFLEAQRVKASPVDLHVALERTVDDVEVHHLTNLQAALLRRANGRMPARAWHAQAAIDANCGWKEAHEASRELKRMGLILPTRKV